MSDNNEVLARLRQAVAGIEGTAPVDPQAAAAARRARKEKPRPTPRPRPYHRMPEGDDWMDKIPVKYRHGENGFDRRLMENVAAAGYRCYTIDQLPDRTAPQLIPTVLDWLEHLEERIPGPETPHRERIRDALIWRLNDSAARGNRHAIDVVIAQIRRTEPPLPSLAAAGAGQVLARIALPRDFDRIAELFHELDDSRSEKFFLTAYFGKVKTAQSRDTILPYLDRYAQIAIPALIKMNAVGVRHRIEPYLRDSWPPTRRYARRAMERLT